MFRLIKEFSFQASHVLPHHEGKCRRLHGHDWHGEVHIIGQFLQKEGPQQGMLVDYGVVSAIIKRTIDECLEHWHLNETMCENPTSENIARALYLRWKQALTTRDYRLEKIVIQETDTSRCEYWE